MIVLDTTDRREGGPAPEGPRVRPQRPQYTVSHPYVEAVRRAGGTPLLLPPSEPDLEAHNLQLFEKYDRIRAAEQRSDAFRCDDAEVLLVACNTPSQMAKGAVQELRALGVKAGLFRPVTLWPFPIDHLKPLLPRVRRILVVEASDGQLEDELRLALSYAGVESVRIEHLRHFGGVLPQQREIVARVLGGEAQP